MSPEIYDAETDYLRKHFEKIAKAHPGVNEELTETIQTTPGCARGMAVALCLALAALAILLAGMVVGHLVLLPDATVWPLGVASLLCAGLSLGGAIAVLRGAA